MRFFVHAGLLLTALSLTTAMTSQSWAQNGPMIVSPSNGAYKFSASPSGHPTPPPAPSAFSEAMANADATAARSTQSARASRALATQAAIDRHEEKLQQMREVTGFSNYQVPEPPEEEENNNQPNNRQPNP